MINKCLQMKMKILSLRLLLNKKRMGPLLMMSTGLEPIVRNLERNKKVNLKKIAIRRGKWRQEMERIMIKTMNVLSIKVIKLTIMILVMINLTMTIKIPMAMAIMIMIAKKTTITSMMQTTTMTVQ